MPKGKMRQLMEKGPNRLSTLDLRDEFFEALADEVPAALEALEPAYACLSPGEIEDLAFRLLDLNAELAGEVSAPTLYRAWSGHYQKLIGSRTQKTDWMLWPWVLRAAARWIVAARDGHPRREKGKPALYAEIYYPIEASPAGAAPFPVPPGTVVHPQSPPVVLEIRGWRPWRGESWHDFRAQQEQRLRVALNQHRTAIEALCADYDVRQDKRNPDHLRWFIKRRILGWTLDAIADEISKSRPAAARTPDARTIGRAIESVATRVEAPPGR